MRLTNLYVSKQGRPGQKQAGEGLDRDRRRPIAYATALVPPERASKAEQMQQHLSNPDSQMTSRYDPRDTILYDINQSSSNS